MKKQLIGLLVSIAYSSFISANCDASLDIFARTSSSQGGAKVMLEVERSNTDKLQVYKTTLDMLPNLNQISGYTRDSLAVVIEENLRSVTNLEANIKRTEEISRQLREIVKENCHA